MSTYKVIQDIEAEDKLVGPLSLRQFIYAGIAALSGYLGFLMATKGAAFMLVVFVPITFVSGFFAFPFKQDQPTEVWALAKIRFFLKPRRRRWDQSGQKELVSITVPKKIERQLTNGLNEDEVQSRLQALANTIDSRGWAVKNVNVNLGALAAGLPFESSDRLVQASNLPQEVSSIDVRASDDILDEAANPVAQQFDVMINASSAAHRQQLIAQMQQSVQQGSAADQQAANSASVAAGQPADYWFVNPPAADPGQAAFVDTTVVTPGAQSQTAVTPQAAVPTPEEEAMIAKFKDENASQTAAYGHLKTLKTPEQLMAEDAARRAVAAASKPRVTPREQAAIIDLANNDDLDVATIARQAHKQTASDNGEVVIPLR